MTTPSLVRRPVAHIGRVETAKQFRRPRTAGVVAAAIAVNLGVCALLAVSGHGSPERLGDWGSVLPRSTGFALPLVALNAMSLLAYPVIASVFAGDAIAGEAGWGSLRYLVARPVSRSRILAAKTAVSAALTITAIAASFLASLLFGAVVFGWRPITVIDLQHSSALHLSFATFDPGTALVRVLAILGVVLASTVSVFACSILLSALTDQSFAAVAGGLGYAFVSRALDNVPGLHSLSPWLPVTDASTTAWTGLLDNPARFGPIGHLLAVQAVYLAGFAVAAWLVFTRRDVLS